MTSPTEYNAMGMCKEFIHPLSLWNCFCCQLFHLFCVYNLKYSCHCFALFLSSCRMDCPPWRHQNCMGDSWIHWRTMGWRWSRRGKRQWLCWIDRGTTGSCSCNWIHRGVLERLGVNPKQFNRISFVCKGARSIFGLLVEVWAVCTPYPFSLLSSCAQY
jgi:hypothetical protein